MGHDKKLLAEIEELLKDHREEEFISLLEDLVRSRFGADTDQEKQSVLREMVARIRDKEADRMWLLPLRKATFGKK